MMGGVVVGLSGGVCGDEGDEVSVLVPDLVVGMIEEDGVGFGFLSRWKDGVDEARL